MNSLDHLFDWVWRTSFQTSLLIGLVLLIQTLGRRRISPQLSYSLWFLVVVRLMLPAAPPSAFSLLNLAGFSSATPGLEQPLPSAHSPAPEPASGIEVPVDLADRAGPFTEPRARTVAPPATSASKSTSPIARLDNAGPDWRPLLGSVWLAGVALTMAIVLIQHRRFSRWIRTQSENRNDELRSLMKQCRRLMGVRRPVRVVESPSVASPALAGWWTPRVLLPRGATEALSRSELEMVFLHELAHVKRGDILLNWLMIALRAAHWFNPLVWFAMRRLRADRELVCDAMVIRRLSPGRRLDYGGALIRIAENFSGAGLCPSAVPVIGNRHEIKRRMLMISNFKSPGKLAGLAALAVLVTVGALTFTRAIEAPQQPGLSEPTPAASTRSRDGSSPDNRRAASQRGLEHLNKQLADLAAELQQKESRLNDLRMHLLIPSDVAAGVNPPGLPSSVLQSLDEQRFRIEAELRGLEALHVRLQESAKLGSEKLRAIVSVAAPDEVLTKLLNEINSADTSLANLRTRFTESHPEFRSLNASLENLSKKADERVQGILSGMKVKMDVLEVQRHRLKEVAAEARLEDASLASKYSPYFEARRELEATQRMRDVMRLKVIQEQHSVAADYSPVTSDK